MRKPSKIYVFYALRLNIFSGSSGKEKPNTLIGIGISRKFDKRYSNEYLISKGGKVKTQQQLAKTVLR